MSSADAEFGDAASPVDLVTPLGHHQLRRAGPGCRGCRARAAVMHDGGRPAEQFPLVDLPDDEAVILVVDQGPPNHDP